MARKKKVALVSAGISRKEYPQFARFMPMTAVGLHYINADLASQGYDVCIVNQTNEELSDEETALEVSRFNPDFVLFNQFFSTRDRLRKGIIPRLDGKPIIGVGGHDATLHSRSLSKEDFEREYSPFDFVWQGDAEGKLGSFLKDFRGDPKPVKKKGDRVKSLDDLPILKHNDYSGDVGFLSTSRGCLPKSVACDFCTTGQFYPDGWKARSLDHVVPELENLVQAGKKYVFVTDDNFLGFSQDDLERGNQIVQFASDLGLKLMIMTTKEQIARAQQQDMLKDWRGTVWRVFLGIENGSREAALKLGKCSARHNKDYTGKCQDAISALYDNCIALFGGYINFNPATTLLELEESAKFLRDNGMEAANFTNLAQGLRFYEGTPICKKFPEQAEDSALRDGEFFYRFDEPRVQRVYEHLADLKKSEEGLMGRFDSLVYESTDLVFLNHIRDSPLGQKYFQLTDKRNQLNVRYFLDLCERAKNGQSLDGRKNRFLEESKGLFREYEKVYNSIKEAMGE